MNEASQSLERLGSRKSLIEKGDQAMLRAHERLLVLTVLSKEEQVWASETSRTPSSQYMVIVDQRIATIVCMVASDRQSGQK